MRRRNIDTIICIITLIGLSVLLIINLEIRYAKIASYYLTSVKSHRDTKIILKVDNGQLTYTQQVPVVLNDDTHVSKEIENIPEINEEHSYSSSDQEYIESIVLQKVPHSSRSLTNKILEKARLKIEYDTSSYNFSQSGVNSLEDLTMESGGQPVRTLVISTLRSGSTFTADLINHAYPITFFQNEPLFFYESKQFRTPREASEALSIVKRLFKCDFEGSDKYFEGERTHFLEGRPNTIMWEYCKYEDNVDLCFDKEVNSRLCKLFPFLNMKLDRLRLQLAEEILDDKTLNVKTFLLVRDPRGVMQSRLNRPSCLLSSDCIEPSLLCADMVSDYVAAGRILNKYPNRLMVLRFEDLVLQSDITINRIFNFLKVQRTQAFDEFLHSHTNVEIAGAHSTSRVSGNIPFKWKTALDFNYVNEIQIACREAMHLWGYKIAHNESHMTSKDFNAVDDYIIMH